MVDKVHQGDQVAGRLIVVAVAEEAWEHRQAEHRAGWAWAEEQASSGGRPVGQAGEQAGRPG